MIGRIYEIEHINSLFESNRFEYLVMYGRRRVGKTTLLQEFAMHHNSVFYPAQSKNDALNLKEFSKTVQMHFDSRFIASFETWTDAFEYISQKASERTALIIDEFPFIALENPTVKSMLQHIIDHKWKNNPNIFLILCGSSVSFMESEVMGAKSPLHDRQTSSLEIKPFDYLESSLFFPEYSAINKILAYGILGGVPRYLEVFDDKKSIEENIAEKILMNGASLREEPSNLLRAELRDTNIYNSILSAISTGKNRIAEISDYIHEEPGKVSKYMLTLQAMRLVEKRIPCGENSESRKGIYCLTDNFFKFWYRYEFTDNAYYELLGPQKAASEIMSDISNHMGEVFEGICKEFFVRLAKAGKLPFVPCSMGKWWGNNPVIKAQDDVDLLMIDKTGKKGIFVECKFTNRPMPHDEYEDLKTAAKAFPEITEQHLYFISKSGYSDSVIRSAREDNAILLGIEDIMNI